jgi:hypothetical protein
MTGKAEVVLEYPDKFHVATFDRADRFDARFEANEVLLTLQGPDDTGLCRSARLHLHPQAFAALLRGLAGSVSTEAPGDTDRETLRTAAGTLYRSLAGVPAKSAVAGKKAAPDTARSEASDETEPTPEEEVLLLHIME